MAKDFPIDLLTEQEQEHILREAQRRFGLNWSFESLEQLLCSEEGFGLTTATVLQRAVCRICQGEPLRELADEPVVRRALGNADLPAYSEPPADVVLIAAVRTAKSMIAAAIAIWASQHCDVHLLKGGEIPRFSILSLELDNARVVMAHLLGALQQPRLERLRVPSKQAGPWGELIDETGADVIGSEFLWHPSGRPVEIRVVAGKRAGGSLVSRWSIGAVFDEAPRMVGSSEGVINYDDARRAVRSRLLPGAQIFSIGSPWQPFGPIYDIVQDMWGKPNKARIVLKANGPDMNPFWWTPARCEEIRINEPETYQTDVLAEFADSEESLFPQALLNGCTREAPAVIEWQGGRDYVAAMDPATRGNAWTLVVASRIGRKKQIVYNTQWQGTPQEPLSPRQVLTEAKAILDGYGLDWCFTDQWAADANKDLASDMGLYLVIEDWTAQTKVNAFLSLASAMAQGTIELPDDSVIARDLKLTKKRPTQRGVSIHLAPTNDGRHCDYSPAIARALFRWIEEEQDIPPKPGEEGYWEHWEEKQIEREVEEVEINENKGWWEANPYSTEEKWV